MNGEKLIYASTEKSADMLYFAKMNIPDPVFAFTCKGEKHALMSPLEFGRAKKESDFDVIHPTSRKPDAEEILGVLKKLGISKISVPREFPVWTYKYLIEQGLTIDVCEGAFFSERRLKQDFEIAEIKKANNAAAQSYTRVWQILQESKIENSKLVWNKKILTSETLKYEIEAVCLSLGANSNHTIAACGNQACDPHNEGSGAVFANELIVVDIFPQMRQSGYFGDMTRTFIKGTPNDAQANIVDAVRKAQSNVIEKIKAGTRASSVHKCVADFFENAGYATKQIDDAWHGFFHSTGHGIGLEVHEEPRISLATNTLAAGEVVTVEPGLYYPGIGACRIEDNVLVRKNDCEKLSDFHYDWIVE